MTRVILWMVVWAVISSPAGAADNGKHRPRKTGPAVPATSPSDTEDAVRVRMETTLGNIDLELDAKRAPITVENFVRYVDEGFYNGTIFHRVIPHFLIQGGGYTTASLLPKTKGLHAPIKNEWNNGLKHVSLTIGAARVPGKPHSATSQFFINVEHHPRLSQAQKDGAGYAAFGRVIQGADVVEKIRTAECFVHSTYREPSGRAVTPVKLIVIKSVYRIDANGEPIELPAEAPEEPEPVDEAEVPVVEPPGEVPEEEVVEPASELSVESAPDDVNTAGTVEIPQQADEEEAGEPPPEPDADSAPEDVNTAGAVDTPEEEDD